MPKTKYLTPIAATVVFTVLILLVFQYRQQSGSPIVSLSESENSTTISLAFEDGKININTASAKDLTVLPGIGDKLSQQIITYRDKNGPFTQISDLKNVSGIGDAKFNAIADYITLGG